MTLRIHDIEWDTDGAEVDLPDEVLLDPEGIDDPDNEVADILSDRYGWCVQSFQVDRDHEPAAPSI